ncbi:hypothetical protein ACFZAI_20075 [Achromobacter sp. NPDC008082]|uniref:hypothetical protein n=1 Tax=Achromobacter sp. NPDC008082 TaxID=3363888 RepID=UPI0036E6111A
MNRAPYFLMVECPGSARYLAFGLRWLALIGSDVPGLARARGRRLRATHVVVGGSPATMAGYGRTQSAWRRGGRAGRSRCGGAPHIQAAAQLYALLYPAGGHCLIPLPDGRYWLAAAQDGMALSQADRVFDSHDEALHAHRRLADDRPGLQAHDAGTVWAALLQAVEPGAQLTPLQTRWAALPLVPRVFLACVGLSAVAPPVWNLLSARFPVREPAVALPSAEPVAALTPSRPLLAGMSAHARTELSMLLRSVGKLPVLVQGWALRRAQCDAGEKVWDCAAVYARASPQATNLQLHHRLPVGWRVSFNPLEEATLRWRIPSALVPLASMTLPSALRVDTELAGALQQLQPAFTAVALAPAVALSSPSPSSPSSTGGPAEAAQTFQPLVRRRALRMHGPLRSFALLPGPIETVRWSRLAVNVQPLHRPTLAASTLVAELHGDLYEQD